VTGFYNLLTAVQATSDAIRGFCQFWIRPGFDHFDYSCEKVMKFEIFYEK
jgi:hypothetical protein